MSANNNSTSGIGFCGLLTIVFIVLKLMHYIDWSWWWVLSPLLIPIAIVLIIVFFIVILRVFFALKVKRTVKESGFAARIKKMERMRENMQRSKFKDNWKS